MPCRNCSCPSCVTLVGSSTPLTTEPPSELTQTNRAATNFEVAQSRIIIDSAEKKMSLLEAAMSDLAKQTTDIRRVIRLHKAVVSPLRAFPPELLVAIFVGYTNMMKNPRTRPASLKPPLSLMWVCSRWRRIVLDTPRFWTRISNSTPMVDFWVNQSK
ncbi:hypothetical protein BD779DRAFT_751643 [Infundibulicybe gibba]|nr:hypothetical protein BD779DRAFT_751643 [Infundibulicybe gibba]